MGLGTRSHKPGTTSVIDMPVGLKKDYYFKKYLWLLYEDETSSVPLPPGEIHGAQTLALVHHSALFARNHYQECCRRAYLSRHIR